MADSPSKNSEGVVRLVVSSNGASIPETCQIVSISICKAANRIPYARIILLDGDLPNKQFPLSDSADFKPGSKIEISAGYGDDDTAIFSGIIVKHGLQISGNNSARLVVECRDEACKLTIGRKNANYVNKVDSDIIAAIIGNHTGLSCDVERTAVNHSELVQHYCTDWDFVLSRAEINGLLVIPDDSMLAIKAPQVDAEPALKVTYGEDLVEFHADIDARRQLHQVKGVAWDPGNQTVVDAVASPNALNKQGDLSSADLANVLNLQPFRLQTPAPLDKGSLESWGNAQQLKFGLARIQGRMKFQGSAQAKVGALISVEGVGKHFSGNVFVSAVIHDISEGCWTTEVEFGLSPEWFSERRDLLSPAASGLLPGIEGLQIGIVMKLDADPDGQSRIQVSLPIFEADQEGIWARLSGFYSSDGAGAFFVPEIGDEVVLGYLNNDPCYPIVLGSLYSSKRKPPYDLTAENSTKAIVTKEQLKLEFDEENKVITITTAAENKIVISDKDKSIVLQDQNDNHVELGTDGICFDSAKDIKITAQGEITIAATGEVDLSSQADVKISGMNINNNANAGFVAKGSASAELSASGQTTIKGSMVLIN